MLSSLLISGVRLEVFLCSSQLSLGCLVTFELYCCCFFCSREAGQFLFGVFPFRFLFLFLSCGFSLVFVSFVGFWRPFAWGLLPAFALLSRLEPFWFCRFFGSSWSFSWCLCAL